MKVVLLAGGLGTRLSEETAIKPKPMVEIGGRPLLWHIMKQYSSFGYNEFVICLGYKGYVIKEYFANYHLHTSDVTFDLVNGAVTIHRSETEPWSVTLVDTGEATMTGGRIKRVAGYIGNAPFLCTYGDGVANIDIAASVAFHRNAGRLATMTAVQPPGRFGALRLQDGTVMDFREKPLGDDSWINGGFFVFEPGILEYISGDDMPLESAPLERLAAESQLGAFRHSGFWHPVDTLRDRNQLEALWTSGQAPWKTWH
ncbi:MAG: glucose-1-phosphate cytidylyltransferase [Candidatus Baltobacteraceae bacterium]